MQTKEPDTRRLLIELEHALIIQFRPTFLTIGQPDKDGIIDVIISSNCFINSSVQDRINDVIQCINDKVEEIALNYMVIVQAYDSSEMDTIIDDVFSN